MLDTACFTGHRQLEGSYEGPAFTRVKEALKSIVTRAYYNHGIVKFISGGAIGIDTIAAEAVIEVWQEYNIPIRLVIARPFPSQACKWPKASQERLRKIWQHATVIDVSPDPYEAWKMQTRNRWMVDRSILLIAVMYEGTLKGGTYNCFQYAKDLGRKILWVNPLKPELAHCKLLTSSNYSIKSGNHVIK